MNSSGFKLTEKEILAFITDQSPVCSPAIEIRNRLGPFKYDTVAPQEDGVTRTWKDWVTLESGH